MKVPTSIPKSACKAYKPSKECLNNSVEPNRILKAELASWDEGLPKSLSDLAVEALIRNFLEISIFEEIPLQKDRNLFLETLPLNLPLEAVIPVIPDGIYWQRRSLERWPTPIEGICNIAQHNYSWKQLYVERDLQEWIEKLIPGDDPKLGVMGPNGWSAWQNEDWVDREIIKELEKPSEGSEITQDDKTENGDKYEKDMFGPDEDIDEGKQVLEYGGDYKDQFQESGDEDEEEDECEDDFEDEMSEDLTPKTTMTKSENVPRTMEKVALVAKYICKLNLRELQVECISLSQSKNYTIEEPSSDHIDLAPILCKLENLQVLMIIKHHGYFPTHYQFSKKELSLKELSIEYKVRNIGINFAWRYFNVTLADISNLSRGLQYCKKMKKFRLRNSSLDNEKLIYLIQSFRTLPELEILDLSHNSISDDGAIALGSLISSPSGIKSLLLSNNQIGFKGIEGLSYAIGADLTPLSHLDLRLNFLIGDEGGALLSSALYSSHSLKSVILAACGLGSKTGILMGQMLKHNSSLTELDLSNNDLGKEAGHHLELGLTSNTTLQMLDLRMTDIPQEVELKIEQLLAKNASITVKKEENSKIFNNFPELSTSIKSNDM